MKSILVVLSFFVFFQAQAQEYFIKFQSDISPDRVQEILRSAGLELRREVPEIGAWLVRAQETAGLTVQSMQSIAMSPEVRYLEANAEIRIQPVPEESATRSFFKSRKKAHQSSLPDPLNIPLNMMMSPNDSLWSDQDQMRRMNVEAAWGKWYESPNIVVAVTDSGVDYTHADLRDQIWVNQDEIAGNGIDDDQNGYVDDIRGYDFSANDNDPMDGHRHGTHVAGIIGATGNNSQGVAGVNWNVQIMPVQFLSASGSGSNAGAVDCILYAANNGAHIINASWGGGGHSQAILDAIAYANSRGAIFIAAAGNDGSNSDSRPMYPAAYDLPGIVSVASTQANTSLSSFSNYGAVSVDLAAPGSNIMSTILQDNYGKLSGTSMASPMVSGVAALILGKNPALSVGDLKNALMNAVRHQSAYLGKVSSQGDLLADLALQQMDATGLQLWPAKVTLSKDNGQHQLTVYHGQSAVGSQSFTSSNTAVATVDAQGKVTGLSPGSATITVQSAVGNAQAEVTVVDVGSTTGCGQLAEQIKGHPAIQQQAQRGMNMGMPLMVGIIVLLRPRRRRRQN